MTVRNDYKTSGAYRVRKVVRLSLTHFFLALVSVTMVLPFIWMILSSFKTDGEMLAVPLKWLPTKWLWQNYVTTFEMAPWGLYFFNTLKITVLSIVLQVFVASTAAYALSRLEYKAKNVVFIIYLSTMMIAYQVTMIPTFSIIRDLGWIDSHLSLIIPGAFSVFAVFMLRQFFLSIPSELEDAAMIDGCGYPRIYFEIIMKNSKPAIMTLILFCFMGTWNDFLRPMLYLNKTELWTMSLGLSKFKGNYVSMWSNMMCGAVVTTIPVIVVFLFAQKYFIEGIVMSGIKG